MLCLDGFVGLGTSTREEALHQLPLKEGMVVGSLPGVTILRSPLQMRVGLGVERA